MCIVEAKKIVAAFSSISSREAFSVGNPDRGAVSRKHGNGQLWHGMLLGSGEEILANKRRLLDTGEPTTDRSAYKMLLSNRVNGLIRTISCK